MSQKTSNDSHRIGFFIRKIFNDLLCAKHFASAVLFRLPSVPKPQMLPASAFYHLWLRDGISSLLDKVQVTFSPSIPLEQLHCLVPRKQRSLTVVAVSSEF